MTQPVDQTSSGPSVLQVRRDYASSILVLTNLCRVVGRAKDEFGSTIVARADVRDVGLILDQDLGTAKVAELEDAGSGVEEQVLGLDVSVADTLGVDVCEGAEELVDV